MTNNETDDNYNNDNNIKEEENVFYLTYKTKKENEYITLINGEPFTGEARSNTFYYINESSISITICSTSQKVSSYGYTFSNVGEHRVMIKINDNNITSFKKMFCRCYNLIKIEGVPSKNINNFRSMFNCCKSLQNIDALKN